MSTTTYTADLIKKAKKDFKDIFQDRLIIKYPVRLEEFEPEPENKIYKITFSFYEENESSEKIENDSLQEMKKKILNPFYEKLYKVYKTVYLDQKGNFLKIKNCD